MSYETVSVRMNRSDNSIKWGFTLRNQGDKIVIATVERDSLSEKAGLRTADEVETVCGRSARGMSVHEATRIVENSHFEVNFGLKRFVTSHTCLPWTLTEKDNKLIVDEVKPGFGSGFNRENFGGNLGQHSPSMRNIPVNQAGSTQRSSYTSQSHSENRTVSPMPHTVLHSPSQYSSSQKTSNFSRTELGNKPLNGAAAPFDSSYSTSNYTSGANYGNPPQARAIPVNYGTSGNPTNKNSFPSDYGSKTTGQTTQPANYSFNNGMTTSSYNNSGAGGVPLNQSTFIQTQHSPNTLQPSSVSPGGTKIFYHSPSSRSQRDLSPNASVRHLQYNSPMNLYSVDTAAEQYSQQTGRPVDAHGRLTSQSPAYLNSETKKLIEESEGRLRRGISPSAQSSSFKRISQAVGAPIQ